METQTRLSRHNKFISAENIVGIFSVSNHNRRLLNELTTRDRNPNVESCNCRNKEECPLGARCTTRNVVYQACISPMERQKDGERVYIGISVGNKDETATDTHFPIQKLNTKSISCCFESESIIYP